MIVLSLVRALLVGGGVGQQQVCAPTWLQEYGPTGPAGERRAFYGEVSQSWSAPRRNRTVSF